MFGNRYYKFRLLYECVFQLIPDLSEGDLLAEGEDGVVVLDPAVLGVVIDPAHLHLLLPVRLGQVVLTNLTIVNR